MTMASEKAPLIAVLVWTLGFLIIYTRTKVMMINGAQKPGCAEPPKIPSRDPIFGLDTVIRTLRELKGHKRMRSVNRLFQQYGHTYQSFPFGRRSIFTIHPRNLQIVFSENERFGVGPLRERASRPMIGRGIVTSDGNKWMQARAMIKPTFNRSEIANPQMFSNHIEKFLQLLQHNETEVDLQPLFDRLVSFLRVVKRPRVISLIEL